MTTNATTALSEKTMRRLLVAILLVAFLARAGMAFYIGDHIERESDRTPGTLDQVSYDELAQRVLQGQGFSYATWHYPWVLPDTQTSYYSGSMVLSLAAVYWVAGYHPLVARLVMALLGTLACYLVYRLGRRLFSPVVALLAAGLAALYLYLIYYNATLMTETPFLVGLLLTLNAAYAVAEEPARRLRWLQLGGALVVTVLFRSSSLFFVALLLAWLAWKTWQATRRPAALLNLAIPLVVLAVAIAPFTIRNYLLFGRFMLLESQFGHVFWNSNHPDQGYFFVDDSKVEPLPREINDLNEADKTYLLMQRGLYYVESDPARFVLLSLSKTRILFNFWPSAGSTGISNASRVLSFGLLWPFMLAGLLLSVRQWRRYVPLYLLVAGHTAIHVASWPQIRYRVPIDPVLILFAASALVMLAVVVAPRLGLRKRAAEVEA